MISFPWVTKMMTNLPTENIVISYLEIISHTTYSFRLKQNKFNNSSASHVACYLTYNITHILYILNILILSYNDN